MGIFSENRAEYVVAELACMSDSITVVPIPARKEDLSLVEQILDLTRLETLCVSLAMWPTLKRLIIAHGVECLKTVIILDGEVEKE